VRRLLERVFHPSSKTERYPPFPSLPPDQSLSEIKQRATVGYLARRFAQRLDLKNADLLFYHSFTKKSFEIPSNVVDEEFPLYLANLLLKWIQDGEEVRDKVKELNLSPDFESCLNETFQEFKEEIISETTFPFTVRDEAVEEAVIETSELKEWQIYRDVMYAVTQKKFLLISKNEIPKYIDGPIICEGIIKERSDIPKCRKLAHQALQKLGFETTNVMSWLLMITEAITNVLKHAEEGKMLLVDCDGVIRVVIEDKGPGFSLKDLPNTTLMAGYSTKKSLGQGFTLMLKMTEQILLYTSSKGSTIILTLNKKERE
jgi:anti-sigma regulatory factor (Ser/Thr protein kinase)